MKIDIEHLINEWDQSWKPPVVPRHKIPEFSGHTISSKTIANLDSKGEGPPSFKMGRTRVYPKADLLKWFKNRMSTAG